MVLTKEIQKYEENIAREYLFSIRSHKKYLLQQNHEGPR